MVMVFTIISTLQEKLTVLVEEMKHQAEEKRLKKLKAEEEAAQVRVLGHQTTSLYDCWIILLDD